MPVNPDGSMRQFNPGEIAAMQIETTNVRGGMHPFETREVGQSILKRTWFCDWESRYDFCKLCCGDQLCYNAGVGNTNKLSRMLPDATYGRHPSFPEIIATKIEDMHGQGRCLGEDDDGMPYYARARVDVLYEHFVGDVRTDADVTYEYDRYAWQEDSEAGADSITGKGGMMRFRRDPATGAGLPDNVPVPYSYNVVRPTEQFIWNWVQVPYEAFTAGKPLFNRVYGGGPFSVTSYQGMVNVVEFLGRPPGTVMFLGVSAKLKRAQSAVGRRWDLKYKFLYTPYGHTSLRYFDLAGAGANNGWFYAGTGAFKTPLTLTDGESIVVGARDLKLLFVTS